MTTETRDGQGAGDRDKPYVFGGDPSLMMTTWEKMHCLILRGEVKDRRGHADGDLNTDGDHDANDR